MGQSAINPGRIILLLVILSAVILPMRIVSAADIATIVDVNKIAPGESCIVSVKVGGVQSVSPVAVPKVEGLSVTFSGTSYAFEMNNGRTWKGQTLQFKVKALREGVFTLPPIRIKADDKEISSTPVKIDVSRKYAGRSTMPFGFGRVPRSLIPDDGDGEDVDALQIKPSIEIAKRQVFAGEPVIVKYVLTSQRDAAFDMRGFVKPPVFDGFVSKEFESKNTESRKKIIASFVLIPQSAGSFPIGGETAVASGGFSSREILFGRETVSVRELPSAGRPKNYSGNVGSFLIESDIVSYECAAFEEKRFTVTVKGSGNFLGLKRPEFELLPDGIKVLYEEGEGDFGVTDSTIKGEKKFLMTVISEKEGVLSTGELSFNFYNPADGAYHTLQDKALSVTVKGGKNDSSLSEKAKGSGVPVIVWIIAGLLFAIILALGIIIHDRRKYKLHETVDIPVKELIQEESVQFAGTFPDVALLEGEDLLRECERILKNAPSSPMRDELQDELYRIRYGGNANSDLSYFKSRMAEFKAVLSS